MEGLESTWALTSALMRLTGGEGGEGSWGLLGLDGKRPLRPFRLSVRTTARRQTCVEINNAQKCSQMDEITTKHCQCELCETRMIYCVA